MTESARLAMFVLLRVMVIEKHCTVVSESVNFQHPESTVSEASARELCTFIHDLEGGVSHWNTFSLAPSLPLEVVGCNTRQRGFIGVRRVF